MRLYFFFGSRPTRLLQHSFKALAVGRDHVWSVLATYMYMYMDSTTACFGCVGFKRFDSGLLTYIANSTTRSSWM